MELKLLVFLLTWGWEPSFEQQGRRDKLALMEHGGRRGEISIIGHWICLARSLSGLRLMISCWALSPPLLRRRVRRPWVGAEGEGVQEGELSPPLLTKGILYSLDSPKVTGLHHCPTLPLPFTCLEELRSLGA